MFSIAGALATYTLGVRISSARRHASTTYDGVDNDDSAKVRREEKSTEDVESGTDDRPNISVQPALKDLKAREDHVENDPQETSQSFPQ